MKEVLKCFTDIKINFYLEFLFRWSRVSQVLKQAAEDMPVAISTRKNILPFCHYKHSWQRCGQIVCIQITCNSMNKLYTITYISTDCSQHRSEHATNLFVHMLDKQNVYRFARSLPYSLSIEFIRDNIYSKQWISTHRSLLRSSVTHVFSSISLRFHVLCVGTANAHSGGFLNQIMDFFFD